MAKVQIDATNKNVQICGKYRYNTQDGVNNLSIVSKRRDYPVVVSRGRKETCVIEAIKNYKAELDQVIAQIKRGG